MKEDVGIVLEVISMDFNAVLTSAPPAGQLSWAHQLPQRCSSSPSQRADAPAGLLLAPDPILGFYQSGGNGLEFTNLIGAVWAAA